MQILKRLGLSVGVLLFGVFILAVTIVGFFKWIITGQSLNDFAAKLVHKLTGNAK